LIVLVLRTPVFLSKWSLSPRPQRLVPGKNTSKESKRDCKRVDARLKEYDDITQEKSREKYCVEGKPRNEQSSYLGERLQDVFIGVFYESVLPVLILLNQTHPRQFV